MGLTAGDVPLVKLRLNQLMNTFGPQNLDSDPLGLVHGYPRREDREVAAFFAAALAFAAASTATATPAFATTLATAASAHVAGGDVCSSDHAITVLVEIPEG